MLFSLVIDTEAGSSGGTSATTSSIDTTGANLLVVAVSDYFQASLGTLTDSKSNTWTPLTTYGADPFRFKLYYCQGGTVGSGHTFTYTGDFPSILVQAWSGSAASPFDQENGAADASPSSLATGSVTPSEDNELLVTGAGGASAASMTINSGFTISGQIAFSGGNNFSGHMAYKVQTSAGAENPTWADATVPGLAVAIATFKAAAAGGTRPVKMAGRWGGFAGPSGGFAA